MREITLEELLEAGCHFGHQVTRQNPKAREYVFEARDNIHIIDLAKTKEGLDAAAAFVKDLASKEGSSIIIVATKRQARGIVEEEAKKVYSAITEEIPSFFYVTSRWIGGILTNFPEVSKNYNKLKDLASKLKNNEEKAKYTKKEVGLWEKERVKLENFYGGVKDMKKAPDALFIIDTHLEDLAVREANRMGVPVVGIVDTNADPEVINYPIPANDDAVGSIKLIVSHIIDAWIEGRKELETKLKNPQLPEEEKVKEVKTKAKKEEKKVKGPVKKAPKVKSESKTKEKSKSTK
ncbi:30S ribosomal protein S2 [Candidatus Microgenomates bacterium]|nr:MAG: 30S ribosomal protein S2 [Candidatus Microgenomates bacterium]